MAADDAAKLQARAVEFRVSGVGGRLCTVTVDAEHGLEALQAAIAAQTGTPVHTQRLFHGLEELTGGEAAPDLSQVITGDEKGCAELLLVYHNPDQADWLRRVAELPEDKVYAWLYNYAPPAARKDRMVVQAAMLKNPNVLRVADPQIRADKEVALAVVGLHHVDSLRCVAPRLWADRAFVLAAVALDGAALRHAAAELRADEEVVLAAVAQKADAFRHAAPELRACREVVLSVVTRSGVALCHAAPELQGDREVALAAVAQRGGALQHVAPELQADREVVLAAVSQDGLALQHAAPELQADRTVVSAALAQDADAARHAAASVQSRGGGPPV